MRENQAHNRNETQAEIDSIIDEVSNLIDEAKFQLQRLSATIEARHKEQDRCQKPNS